MDLKCIILSERSKTHRLHMHKDILTKAVIYTKQLSGLQEKWVGEGVGHKEPCALHT